MMRKVESASFKVCYATQRDGATHQLTLLLWMSPSQVQEAVSDCQIPIHDNTF